MNPATKRFSWKSAPIPCSLSKCALVWSLMFLSGFLLNTAGASVGPRLAHGKGAAIVLAYVWLSLVRANSLRQVTVAPKAS